MGTPTSADDAAQRLANVADPILAQNKRHCDAFESVDPFNEVTALRIPMQKSREFYRQITVDYRLLQDSKVRQAIKLINEAAGQNKRPKIFQNWLWLNQAVPFAKFDPKQVNPQIDDMLTAIAKVWRIKS